MIKQRFLRAAASVTAAGLVLGLASTASALDAWRDRRGLFYGAGVGFGIAKPTEGDADNEVSLAFRGRLGGGISSQLTIDADLGYTTVVDPGISLITGLIGVNVFLFEGLYVRGLGGVGHIAPEKGDNFTGLAVGAGAGYEFFANANLAVGVGAEFQQHFYKDFDFRIIGVMLTATHY